MVNVTRSATSSVMDAEDPYTRSRARIAVQSVRISLNSVGLAAESSLPTSRFNAANLISLLE